MATLLGKAVKWGKKNAGKVAAIALPVAALGASLLPGVGTTISNTISKVGDKLKGHKTLTAVAKAADTVASPEAKKGFLGLFTGKAKAKKALEKRSENEAIYNADDNSDLERLKTLGKIPAASTPPLTLPRYGSGSRPDPKSTSGSGLGIAAALIGAFLFLKD